MNIEKTSLIVKAKESKREVFKLILVPNMPFSVTHPLFHVVFFIDKKKHISQNARG